MLALIAAQPAFGWGCTGHQTVALIARAQLNPQARQMVDSLLSGTPIDPGLHRFCAPTQLDVMADVATWADDEREMNPRTAAWHFLDMPLGATRAQLDRFCEPGAGCVTQAIQKQLDVLKSTSAARADKVQALMFLIHFVGDLHQPLHIATNNDRGANCLPVAFLGRQTHLADAARGIYKPELHGVWDTELPEHAGNIRHSSHDADVKAFTKALGREFSSQMAMWRREPVDLHAWAWESHQRAVSDAYGRLATRVAVEMPVAVRECSDDDRVSDRLAKLHESIQAPYITAVTPVVREQLAKAGTRLAILLNQLWK
ncbi:MAG: S1/P1 nuclease [Acidobacteriia bacterium]|nr:S1/P1 nuclease [Terriglobia bacterium]